MLTAVTKSNAETNNITVITPFFDLIFSGIKPNFTERPAARANAPTYVQNTNTIDPKVARLIKPSRQES